MFGFDMIFADSDTDFVIDFDIVLVILLFVNIGRIMCSGIDFVFGIDFEKFDFC